MSCWDTPEPRPQRHRGARFPDASLIFSHGGGTRPMLSWPSQVLFGNDSAFRTAAEHVEALAAHGFSDADLRGIERDNALRLLPRLQAGA